MKTFTQRFSEIKQALMEGLRQAAAASGNKVAVIPGCPQTDYSSVCNGWCSDYLAGVAPDGVVFFVEEGCVLPDGYDLEDDEDELVCAYMSLDDIMLDGLASAAEALSLMPETVAEARRLIAEVYSSVAGLPDGGSVCDASINVTDEEGFWSFIDISSAGRDGVMHKGMLICWDRIPTDDRCTVLDSLAA